MEFEKPRLAARRPGPFELGPVAGGASLLELRAPPGYYAVSASISGADALRNIFHPREHALELVLGRNAAELTVHTVDDTGQPVGSASVLLGCNPSPDSASIADLFVSESDQDGAATITGIPPGWYRLPALRSGAANLVKAASVFRSCSSGAERIGLNPNEKRTVRATVRPAPR